MHQGYECVQLAGIPKTNDHFRAIGGRKSAPKWSFDQIFDFGKYKVKDLYKKRIFPGNELSIK